MEIRSERLLLRELTEHDLVAFHKLQSDPQVTKYTKQGPNKSLDDSQQMLDDLLVLINRVKSHEICSQPVLYLAITIPPSTELIGLIGAFRPREVGFSLHPGYWGKGIAQEATRAFCKWYSSKYPGQQLFAKVNGENDASKRCLERCGFSKASELEEKGDEAYRKDRDRETWLLRGVAEP